ncbi:MAG TPA: hypothetical protein VKE51_40455 [Vicinamibacterales bacterium]|nr:hypothetical protein [Vicinamibacterales bacterium]
MQEPIEQRRDHGSVAKQFDAKRRIDLSGRLAAQIPLLRDVASHLRNRPKAMLLFSGSRRRWMPEG